jgi:hypothetical protein
MEPNASDAGKDTTPVDQMNVKDTTASIAKDFLGEPNAKVTDGTPADQKQTQQEPTKTVDDSQKQQDQTQEPTKKTDESIPQIPDVLIKKQEPTKKVDDEFDVNKLDLEQIDEKLRPNFAKMRDKLKGTTKDLEAITKERDELKTKLEAKPAATTEEWNKERTELLDQISKLNLEADPRFVAKYEAQTKPVAESLKATIESYNVENLNAEDVVEFAANLTAKDRADFLAGQLPEEISQAALSTLLPAFSQLDIIENARQAELQNHQKVLADMQQEGTEQAKANLVQLRTEAKNEAVKNLTENEILLKKVDGNEDWNRSVDGLLKSVDAIFQTDDPKVHAEALAMSRLAPIYKLMFFKERELREHYEQAIKDRNITLPDIGSDTDTTSSDTSMKLSDMTPNSVAARIASGIK